MFREMRRKKQQVSDEECRRVLTTAKRGVLSVIGDMGYPYAVPVDFLYDENDGKVYIHSSKSGHKIDSILKDNKVCFTVWDEGYHKDDWSFFVTSVIIMGKAELVEDRDTAYDRVRRLGLKYYPSAAEVDVEMERDFARVALIAVTADNMTGKLVHEK